MPFVIVKDALFPAWNMTANSLFWMVDEGDAMQVTVTFVTDCCPNVYRTFFVFVLKNPATFSVIVLFDTVRYVSVSELTSVFRVSYSVLSVCRLFSNSVMFVDAVVIVCYTVAKVEGVFLQTEFMGD